MGKREANMMQESHAGNKIKVQTSAAGMAGMAGMPPHYSRSA